jgi:hypothetical protein
VQLRGAVTPKQVLTPGAEARLATDAGIRVKGHNVIMLTAESNAKTVTSLLTLPSVLVTEFLFFSLFFDSFKSHDFNWSTNSCRMDYH